MTCLICGKKVEDQDAQCPKCGGSSFLHDATTPPVRSDRAPLYCSDGTRPALDLSEQAEDPDLAEVRGISLLSTVFISIYVYGSLLIFLMFMILPPTRLEFEGALLFLSIWYTLLIVPSTIAENGRKNGHNTAALEALYGVCGVLLCFFFLSHSFEDNIIQWYLDGRRPTEALLADARYYARIFRISNIFFTVMNTLGISFDKYIRFSDSWTIVKNYFKKKFENWR